MTSRCFDNDGPQRQYSPQMISSLICRHFVWNLWPVEILTCLSVAATAWDLNHIPKRTHVFLFYWHRELWLTSAKSPGKKCHIKSCITNMHQVWRTEWVFNELETALTSHGHKEQGEVVTACPDLTVPHREWLFPSKDPLAFLLQLCMWSQMLHPRPTATKLIVHVISFLSHCRCPFL